MARTWDDIAGSAGSLAVHVVAGRAGASSAGAVVVCHGFPVERDAALRTGRSFPALADRIAAESGLGVVAGCLRGVGPSAGDFSLDGWLDDLRVFVDHADDLVQGSGVWIVGFGTSGALALCLAADDQRVRGVACLGSSATFSDWAQDLPGMLGFARQVGVVRDPAFPSDVRVWGRPFTALAPQEAVAKIAPRPVLIVHGADDDSVPVADARVLADAAGPTAELRLLAGAGHRLRADPRAIALLVGWLERQGL